MKWLSINELRDEFLKFFEQKNHLITPSFSLIPNEDKSLLLINSGMAPMKKYFTGELQPPSKRLATCQKCIRTPDIERVGITSRHATFFEMLGNFSFGDYFKSEAIAWSWEFLTKVLKIDEDKLWISIYKEDDEAFKIWNEEIGIDKEKIVKLGKEDNFWEHGTGPCGPCSEIYFDRGEKYGCNKKGCAVGCECDRYVEIWNLVFTQFDSDSKGNYKNLDHPNIDTGMGLERLACIMQDVDNIFLTDVIKRILNDVCKISNKEYGKDEKIDISIRVITDHIRSIVFMISDGVIPSNEGRGYVLRRLLRRASRHGRLIGVNNTFLSSLSNIVIEENKKHYPELFEKRDYIFKLINTEEQNFMKTIEQGLQILNILMDTAEQEDKYVLSGENTFQLHDTYGFPVDLTKEIVAEKGMTVDEDEFDMLLSKQRTKARNARKGNDNNTWKSNDLNLSEIKSTNFIGYDILNTDVKILTIMKDGNIVEKLDIGDSGIVILDKTPFYAESGGQVGDTGYIKSSTSRMAVLDTTQDLQGHYLHHVKVVIGSFTVNDEASAFVDKIRRRDIMRNHTATHLLHSALKKVIGSHVEQAGQLVNEEYLRFDFTHFSNMTEEEIAKVEDIVNTQILKAIPVNVSSMNIKEAKESGAVALFGEKYGDIVRVVSLENGFSKELCGGTHMNNTAKLGLFKIETESSVASGVRRIVARTGIGMLKFINDKIELINKAAKELKINNYAQLPEHCKHIYSELKEKDNQIEKLSNEIANLQVNNLINNANIINETKIIIKNLKTIQTEVIKNICDRIREKEPNSIVMLIFKDNGKNMLACAIGKNALNLNYNAGNIVKKAAQIAGGNGGGRKDFAMAGIKEENKIDLIINEMPNIIKS